MTFYRKKCLIPLDNGLITLDTLYFPCQQQREGCPPHSPYLAYTHLSSVPTHPGPVLAAGQPSCFLAKIHSARRGDVTRPLSSPPVGDAATTTENDQENQRDKFHENPTSLRAQVNHSRCLMRFCDRLNHIPMGLEITAILCWCHSRSHGHALVIPEAFQASLAPALRSTGAHTPPQSAIAHNIRHVAEMYQAQGQRKKKVNT